jgi:hypothetical protein
MTGESTCWICETYAATCCSTHLPPQHQLSYRLSHCYVRQSTNHWLLSVPTSCLLHRPVLLPIPPASIVIPHQQRFGCYNPVRKHLFNGNVPAGPSSSFFCGLCNLLTNLYQAHLGNKKPEGETHHSLRTSAKVLILRVLYTHLWYSTVVV